MIKKTVFNIHHPVVAALYFASLLIFTMAVIQPVYIALSLLGALSLNLFFNGWRRMIRGLLWQIPLIVVITLINPLFSSIGTTEVLRLGARAFYLESFIYGACFGALLVAVLLWFLNASIVLSSDKVTSLLGSRMPTLSLMISMMLRLVPQLLRQAKEINTIQEINTPCRESGRQARLAARVRQSSVLMSWSMENSLDTADAMRARGWGSTKKRTTYQHHHFKMRDGVLLAVLIIFLILNTLLAIVAVSQFEFYPTISTLVLWWGYIPYAAFAFLPLIIQGFEGLRWRR